MNLIPMKDSDYAAYLTNAVFEYANDKVQAGTWAKDEALALAKESFASLLPQGLPPKTITCFLYLQLILVNRSG